MEIQCVIQAHSMFIVYWLTLLIDGMQAAGKAATAQKSDFVQIAQNAWGGHTMSL